MPVCRLLSRLRVKPRHVTIFRGLLLVPFFFLWIYRYYPASAAVLALSIMLDAIDGDLARMRRPDSDLGKFEDIMVDNVMVVVLPLALIYDGLVSGFLGAYYIFIVSLSWWLSVFGLYSYQKTDWIIKPQASRSISTLRFYVVTLLIFGYAFWRVDVFTGALIALSAVFSLYALFDYAGIIRSRP